MGQVTQHSRGEYGGGHAWYICTNENMVFSVKLRSSEVVC